MKKAIRLISLLLVAVLLVSCFVGCKKKGNETFLIGATGPLTGEAMSYGVSVKNGAELAVEEINKAGGLNGVKFEFKILDDKASEVEAGNAYNTLYDEGMIVSLGSVTSGSCKAFAAKAAKDNIFFMTPSASADDVIKDRKNAFRLCFGDPDQGILAAEEITKTFKNIGCIYDTSDTYSTGIYAAFDAKMKELGVEYKTYSFDADSKKNFNTQVDALKDCDAIFLPIYYTEAGLIAKACSSKGVTAELFGCDGLDGVAEQIDSTVTNSIRYITPFDVNSTDKKVADFVKAYEKKYGTKPDQFAADAYDVVYVLYEAMKKAGVKDPTMDPSELCDKLIKIVTSKDFSYSGTTGEMTWDASGACSKKPVIVSLNK